MMDLEKAFLLIATALLAAAPAAAQPDVVGQWEGPYCLPQVGTHMLHMHTGKVLLFPGHYSESDHIEAWVWTLDSHCMTDNPRSGFDPTCIKRIDNDDSNLFCSGHSPLDDGKLLITGGHHPPFGSSVGLPDANIFEPEGETWTGPSAGVAAMDYRRWYPTNTTLADGRVLVTSGSNRRCNGGDENGHNCIDHYDCASHGSCVNDVCVGGDKDGQACEDSDPDCINMSGNGTCDSIFVNDVSEVYDPISETWTSLDMASKPLPFYPLMFQLPNGEVLYAGAETAVGDSISPLETWTLDVGAQTWTQYPNSNVNGGSAVMYEPGKVLKSGGRNMANAQAGAQIIDMNQMAPAWETVESMDAARVVHNLTLLPDGTVLATGGTRFFNREYNYLCVGGERNNEECSPANVPPGDSGFPCAGGLPDDYCPGGTCTGGDGTKYWVSQAEIYDPSTKQWDTMAHMQTPRQYHSNAVLLPDGRVVVAGGGQGGGAIHNYSNYEIFSPPYLFKGARPTVTDSPPWFGTGEQFFVETPDAGDVTSAVLIRLAAATHGFDENQRLVPLAYQAMQNGLQITGAVVSGNAVPFDHNVVPPGYYMLFVVNSNGVPSIGRYVRMLGNSPIAICMDVDADTDPGLCTAEVDVDDGSFDPNGGPLTYEQAPPSPYDVGTTEVELTVTDNTGLMDTCEATVTVTDNEPPVPMCNAPATVDPTDAPISFTATATDNCGVASVAVTGFDCFQIKKNGKVIDKKESCIVSFAGDGVTIDDVGGVHDRIQWDVHVEDVHGNVADATCEVLVVNPSN